jgi:small subunit ribosomal protein S18
MAGRGQPKRTMKPRDKPHRGKKKVSVLTQEKIEYVDYKDVNVLRRFMSDRAKIRARRVTGNDTQQQREIARAIKNAREMALVPYTNRVTTQRGGNRRDNERGGRADGPAPRPSGPPPGPGAEGDDVTDIDAIDASTDEAAEVDTTEAE